MAFISFHSFTDEEVAADFAERLQENNIEFRVEKTPAMLDSVIIGTSSIPGIVVKIRQEDFIKANAALESFYGKLAESVDPGYYLFEFSDEELLEILKEPDTWGYLDQGLAKKILIERGHRVDKEMIATLKAERKKVLAKPEKAGTWFIVFGYFFVVTGMAGLINMLTKQAYDFSPGGSFIGLLIGRHISGDKRVLPDGEIVHSYRKSDRSHGQTIAIACIVLLVLSIAVFLFLDSRS